MEKICLDFDAALDFLRGEPTTIEKLKYYADKEELCISSFVFLQLLGSVSKNQAVMAFANSVTVLPFDRRSAQIAANIIKETDPEESIKKMESILIAAICIANDAFLFSRTFAKFDGIKGLRKV